MTILVNNQAVNVPNGTIEVGPLNLPQGTQNLLVTYACGTWPAISDGSVTFTIKISDDNGATYRDDWSDTIQHVQLKRGGVVQNSANFGIGLQAPFGPTSKLKISCVASIAFSTTVTVQAV